MNHTIREYAERAGITLDSARKRVTKTRSEFPDHFEKISTTWTFDDTAMETLMKLNETVAVTVIQSPPADETIMTLREENAHLKDLLLQYQNDALEERNANYTTLENRIRKLEAEVEQLKNRHPRFGWK